MEDLLYSTYSHLIQSVNTKTHRFLFDHFSLKNRLTGLIGARGVGKTTLLLQYIKEHLNTKQEAFYFTADHIYFNETTLLEFVSMLYNTQDIRFVFIDEVHKYKNWQQELKNIYDAFPLIHVAFSGSSSLDLVKGSYDLSRRAKLYHLPGLSFREYLYLCARIDLPVICMNDLLTNPIRCNALFSQVPRILGYFNDYLRQGYYPFVFEDENSYLEKVLRIIEKTIYEDIAEYYNLKTESLHYFKKILGFLASIPPGQVNTHNVAKNLGIDHKTAFNYLTMLQETGLVRMLYLPQGGNALLKKPEKIFLHNASLLYALNKARGLKPPIGNVRELFLFQSINDANYQGYYCDPGDLLVNETILEIGGRNKTMSQLKKTSSPAFLVKDGIAAATAQVIPLYYFGFLY